MTEFKYGNIAQLVERTPDKGEVKGSIPFIPTYTEIAQRVEQKKTFELRFKLSQQIQSKGSLC